MATYVILSRFSPEAFAEPKDFRKLADAVSSRIKKECKGVTWKQSFATLGRFDVVDIVEADDPKVIASFVSKYIYWNDIDVVPVVDVEAIVPINLASLAWARSASSG